MLYQVINAVEFLFIDSKYQNAKPYANEWENDDIRKNSK